MEIQFHPAKRVACLEARGLDFAQAHEVFAGHHFTAPDLRPGYVEPRFITVGLLDARMVILVWTLCGSARRLFGMRKANGREEARYKGRLD